MKSFIAFAALVAIAVAGPLKPLANAELEAIVAAINSPSTNPATAALLEQQLFDIIGALNPISVGPAIIPEPVSVGPALIPEPVAVGPAIIPNPIVGPAIVGPAIVPEPVSVGPAIIPEPVSIEPAFVHDDGVVTAPIAPSPVVVGPIAEGAPAPLVQIIVNIKQAAETSPIAVAPVAVPEIMPEPVHVVETAHEPVHVVETAPEPVQVVEVAPTPVQVIEAAPVPAEPVIIGTPILPSPAVVLPEELN